MQYLRDARGAQDRSLRQLPQKTKVATQYLYFFFLNPQNLEKNICTDNTLPQGRARESRSSREGGGVPQARAHQRSRRRHTLTQERHIRIFIININGYIRIRIYRYIDKQV